MVFQQIIALDEHYMFTVQQRVTNGSNKAANVFIRSSRPARHTRCAGFLHSPRGTIGGFNGVLKEVDYDDLQDSDTKVIANEKSTGGWIGITDKYWLAALILIRTPPQTRVSQTLSDRVLIIIRSTFAEQNGGQRALRILSQSAIRWCQS